MLIFDFGLTGCVRERDVRGPRSKVRRFGGSEVNGKRFHCRRSIRESKNHFSLRLVRVFICPADVKTCSTRCQYFSVATFGAERWELSGLRVDSFLWKRQVRLKCHEAKRPTLRELTPTDLMKLVSTDFKVLWLPGVDARSDGFLGFIPSFKICSHSP